MRSSLDTLFLAAQKSCLQPLRLEVAARKGEERDAGANASMTHQPWSSPRSGIYKALIPGVGQARGSEVGVRTGPESKGCFRDCLNHIFESQK